MWPLGFFALVHVLTLPCAFSPLPSSLPLCPQHGPTAFSCSCSWMSCIQSSLFHHWNALKSPRQYLPLFPHCSLRSEAHTFWPGCLPFHGSWNAEDQRWPCTSKSSTFPQLDASSFWTVWACNPPPRSESLSFLDSHGAVPLLFGNHWLQSLMAVSVPFACLFRRTSCAQMLCICFRALWWLRTW